MSVRESMAPKSTVIVSTLNGQNLCSSLGTLADMLEGDVEPVNVGNVLALQVTDPNGSSFVILPTKNRLQPIPINCINTQQSFLSSLFNPISNMRQVQQPTIPMSSVNQSSSMNNIPTTSTTVGAMRRWGWM